VKSANLERTRRQHTLNKGNIAEQDERWTKANNKTQNCMATNGWNYTAGRTSGNNGQDYATATGRTGRI